MEQEVTGLGSDKCPECPYVCEVPCNPRRTMCYESQGMTGKSKPRLREEVDMVNHPPHYRGPTITKEDLSNVAGEKAVSTFSIDCIDVIRHIPDMRLANAMKYIWRVAFGGKDNDHEDIKKAVWYLNDWLENKVNLGE